MICFQSTSINKINFRSTTMTTISDRSSLKWQRRRSPSTFHSTSMEQIEHFYDGSMIVPAALSERRVLSQRTTSNFTDTFCSNKDEIEVRKPKIIVEEELERNRSKLDKNRVSLSVSRLFRFFFSKIENSFHRIRFKKILKKTGRSFNKTLIRNSIFQIS